MAGTCPVIWQFRVPVVVWLDIDIINDGEGFDCGFGIGQVTLDKATK